jgi:CxxH/CxxC protein (TIGR04129 family)
VIRWFVDKNFKYLGNNKRNEVGGIEMIYCCEDHVELALDVAVDESGSFPELNKVENKLSTTCEYCQKEAVYIVGNE